MKAIVSVLLVLAMLVSSIPIFVSAETETEVEDLYDVLRSGLLSCSEEIDISAYGVRASELHAMLDIIYKNEPMLFYWSGRYSYSFYVQDEPIEVFPHYEMAEPERALAAEYLNERIDGVIAMLPQGLDDYEKALWLHDYVCVNFEYDKSYATIDIYNMLLRGVGNCTGYTLLYDELLTRAGIESRAVVSNALNHMWNEVYINGGWYHIDTTWDDPLPNRFGEVRHTNFLLDDEAISLSHNGEYFAEYPCEDKSFTESAWRYYNSPFSIVNGVIYAVEFNEIVSFDLYGNEYNTVLTVTNDAWYAADGGYLGYCIGLGDCDGWLYFNDERKITAYNPETKRTKTVFTQTLSGGEIIGMYIFGNMLYCLSSPTGYAEQGSISVIELSPFTEVGGDANGDGTLDPYDYIYVRRVYFGTLIIGEAESKRADVDCDGEINQYDYILVKRAYFGTYTFD